MKRQRLVAVFACTALALMWWYAAGAPDTADEPWPAPLDDRQFWAMVQGFSEPDGIFVPRDGYRSDNLVSNERSLQQVMPILLQRRRSGAYLGVGPEQNFTYITAIEPTIAFVIDLRRENLLLHLMYKAVAEESIDRAEFLSRLFARPRPPGLGADATSGTIFAAFEGSPPSADLARATLEKILDRLENIHRFPLTSEDRVAIGLVYSKFREGGPGMRWDPAGGAWMPTYAELMAHTDPEGNPRSYLASEDAFRVFRRYQLRNRIVPLVGDFGGRTTLRSVGEYLASQGMVVAAFYASNVEGYLRGEAPDQFVANVAALPRDEHSTFIRTRFNIVGFTQDRPDYETTTFAEPIRQSVSSLLTVDAPASLEPAAQRIRNLDLQPLGDALQRAGLALPPRVLVTLVPEDDPRARNIPVWFVGFASGIDEIIIVPDRVSSYPFDSLESVMRHEVVHLALNARAGGRSLPRWFHEGVAVLIESGWGLDDRLRLIMAGFSSPPLDDVTQLFASDAPPDTAQAYLLAAALVDELRRAHGAAFPGRIAARVAAGEPFARAFEIETGETPALAAARAWRSYRRWTSWLPLATSASALWGLILVLAFAAFFIRLSKRAQRRKQWDDGGGLS